MHVSAHADQLNTGPIKKNTFAAGVYAITFSIAHLQCFLSVRATLEGRDKNERMALQ